MARRRIAIFVSWAGKDKALKGSLLDRLAPHLRSLPDIEFDWWEMSHLEAGVLWRTDILSRLNQCDAGLQLLSPNFLDSSFIVNHEIPPFIGPDAPKRALPVGLKPVPLDVKRRNLHGVHEHQLFRLGGKCYSECSAKNKDRFALELADAIQDALIGRPAWRRL